MLYFESDYTLGSHPKILENLLDTNMQNLSSYGLDCYSERAKEKIKKACNNKKAEVYFLAGGTQTNKIVISSLLKAYEGVVAATSGHIYQHEAGAIEASGHKVLEIDSKDGKIEPAALKKYLEDFYADENHSHMVYPGMVYISHPTEYGTLYSKNELTMLKSVCSKYDIPLYLDGARLGYGIMSDESDLTLEDISSLTDVFYIGGTKVGALCGEAVVFTKENTPKNFVTVIKQNGALLAKGRVLGVQFDTLFTDDLYFKISKNAIDMANKLKEVLTKKGYKFLINSPTNQQFVILSNDKLEELKKNIALCFWQKIDDNHTAVRFATSWATTEKEIDELEKLL